METTAEKLTYLNNTKLAIKNELNKLGAEIEDSDTFRSYANALESIYNDYPTVSDTDSSISLNNTKKAPFKKLDLNSTELTQDGTPTPDNPVDVNVIKGDNTITISNSDSSEEQNYPITLSSDNLLNPPTKLVEVTQNGLTFTPVYASNILLYINVNGTATADTDHYIVTINNRLTLPAGSYLFSSGVEGSNTTYFMNFSARNLSVLSNYSGNTTVTINNSDDFWFSIKVRSGITINNVKFKPFMRLSTSTSGYVPYIPNPIEYCKIGDYRDRFFKNVVGDIDYDNTLIENEWYLKKMVGKFEVTNDNKTIFVNFGTSYSHTRITTTKNSIGCLNGYLTNVIKFTNYKEVTATTQVVSGSFASNFASSNINIWNDDFQDLEDAQNKMVGTIIYFPLATPTYTHISQEDYPTLKGQLDNLYNNSKSYNGQTNIAQTNDDLPFNISVSALLKASN